jgi:hypothetical protein
MHRLYKKNITSGDHHVTVLGREHWGSFNFFSDPGCLIFFLTPSWTSHQSRNIIKLSRSEVKLDMLPFRRLPATRLAVSRSNVTLSRPDESPQWTEESPCTSTEVPLLRTRPSRRRRPTFYTKGRPAISPDNPRTWNRPLAPGVLPAYDEALKIINRDSAALKKQCEGLRAILRKLDAGEEVKDDQMSGKLKEKLRILEVQSEINLPSVRWTIANGMGECGLFYSGCQQSLCINKFSGYVKSRPSTSC